MAFLGKLFGGGGGDPYQQFWQWFQANSAELLKVSTCQEPICKDLYARMKRVNPGLVYAFGPVRDGGREFVVSADGNKSLFPIVQRLVAVAPRIPGWLIIAFRPATGFGMSTRIGEHSISPDDFWFSAKQNGVLVDLKLHVRLPDPAIDHQMVLRITFLLLDHGLGEYTVETRIGQIDVQPLTRDPAELSLRPLKELPDVLKQLAN